MRERWQKDGKGAREEWYDWEEGEKGTRSRWVGKAAVAAVTGRAELGRRWDIMGQFMTHLSLMDTDTQMELSIEPEGEGANGAFKEKHAKHAQNEGSGWEKITPL